MSFNRMGLDKLKEVASFFDVPVEATDGKEDIIFKLSESGKTFNQWKKFNEEGSEKTAGPDEIQFASNLLLKMNRRNPTFVVYGYRFTNEHPYQVVPADDAQRIMDEFEGFAIATPSEMKSYYDK